MREWWETPKINLRKPSFRKWLKSKPPDTVVGRSNGQNVCPLAEYIKSQLEPAQQSMVDVGVTRIEVGFYTKKFESGSWIDRFITKVDGDFTHNYTAQEALAILDGGS